MPRERSVFCGGLAGPTGDRDTLALALGGNVSLEWDDVRLPLIRPVSAVVSDLVEIAAYVYVADQATKRGRGDGHLDGELGEGWRRRFRFKIPVREPDRWRDPRVADRLVELLTFLSDDEYEFEFAPRRKSKGGEQLPIPFQRASLEGTIDEVLLFSGGLDSTAGAVRESLVAKRKALLVNHRSNTKVSNRIGDLFESLAASAGDRRPLLLPVRIHKDSSLNQEYTQRSRSFLYAAVGGSVAHLIGLDRVRFYENGVIGLNLPHAASVVGGRASRTTHPRVLRGFAGLFAELFEKPFTVENPFEWKTKTEVVQSLIDAGSRGLIGLTNSCAHLWQATLEHPHCGICSQCIDRRFAVLASGADHDDPVGRYAVELELGEREESEDLALLAGYLETANEVSRFGDAGEFFARFGEATRAVLEFDDPNRAAEQIFQLYSRHAKQVQGVGAEIIRRHAEAIFDHSLPERCVARLVAGLPGPNQIVRDPQSLWSGADYVFRPRGQAWEVRVAGGEPVILLGQKGFAYLHALLMRPDLTSTALQLVSQIARRRLATGSSDSVLDDEAVAGYRARLLEINEQLEDARELGDEAAQLRLEEEKEEILRELKSNRGLKGLARKLKDEKEAFRKSVGKAIDRALKDAAIFCPPFAEHFRRPRLQLGAQIRYVPDSAVEWDTGG